MKNERRRFSVVAGSTTLFDAYEYSLAGSNGVYLTALEGWDDFAGVQVNLEPKLVGAGAYVISTHISERVLTATFSVISDTNVRTWLEATKTAMMNFTEVTLQRTYSNASGSVVRREVLKGLVTAVVWDRLRVNAQITLTITCAEPVKTVYLNGSATPVAGGAL